MNIHLQSSKEASWSRNYSKSLVYKYEFYLSWLSQSPSLLDGGNKSVMLPSHNDYCLFFLNEFFSLFFFDLLIRTIKEVRTKDDAKGT